MLKIKDNVDLKELERLGFEYDNDNGKYIFNICLPNDKGGISLTVQAWDRKIYLWSNTSNNKNEEIIEFMYDLIQTNLVEKIKN